MISDGSYTCTCKDGYFGTGIICNDIDECMISNGNCGEGNVTRASCVNTMGSFMCNCNAGFENEPICSDIDECLSNPCSVDANCQNTDGSVTCTCKDGFNGNGLVCNGSASVMKSGFILVLILFLTTFFA